jgi:uncharacterized protein with NRDE domain
VDAGNVNETEMLRLLEDREKGPVTEVRSGRLSFDKAHAITAPFIVMPEYGTRCSTVVLADSDGNWRFIERRFDARGAATGNTRVSFDATENSQ